MATVGHSKFEKRCSEIKHIKADLDNTFGKEASILIFKTLKLVYGMDADEVVSNPAKFEGIMKRMLGQPAVNALKANSESA